MLIMALAVLFLLGLWLPQKGVLQYELYQQWRASHPSLVALLDTLKLTEIHVSPLALGLWAAFFINLALVTWNRIPALRAQVAVNDNKLRDPRTAAGYHHRSVLPLPFQPDFTAISQALRSSGYRVFGSAGRFYAVKNRFSPVASLLFHLSFFLLLLGGVISMYTRFTGVLGLAAGETFDGAVTGYSGAPRMPRLGSPPDARIQVLSIAPVFEANTPTGLLVRLQDEKGRVHDVDINSPYKTGHTSFVLKDLGVAPLFVVRDASGREIDGVFVKLDVLKGKEDHFELGGYQFTAVFYPDYVVRDGNPGSASDDIKNPAFGLTIRKNGAVVGDKVVRPGETFPVGDRTLTLAEMRFWVKVMVVKEYGLEVVYAGFLLATIGLVMRLVFYRREIIGAVEVQGEGETLLVLAGRAEYYRDLAEDEFSGTFTRIGASMAATREP
jgi:cytochrome c biogenesis protein ResB